MAFMYFDVYRVCPSVCNYQLLARAVNFHEIFVLWEFHCCFQTTVLAYQMTRCRIVISSPLKNLKFHTELADQRQTCRPRADHAIRYDACAVTALIRIRSFGITVQDSCSGLVHLCSG
jgi:hypothetical protein